ncbi:hypothetical protein SAMN02745136_00434 [Anaerocolumna jejuensis DSM 15929]|uniref:Uncharacterized protein n=1 Tax=Anaerocolumna jejuensis DSM 15929 TaxID=1121322 RepID=A0A1M6KFH1_9FIRM|nr:hypothetical protein [Anaerocolumna jejuensis]SHJ57684.1 hypothetical protein SAMN02745136_00434 [Anaerocolumna jejuensis DSM 15929]
MGYAVGGYSAFKHLDGLINQIDETKKLVGSEGDKEDLDAQLSLLAEIKEYEMGFTWLKQRDFKEKVKQYITNGFDYKLLMEVYGATYDRLRGSMHYANSEFQKHIGQNTLKLIEAGDVAVAQLQFYKTAGLLKDTDIFPQTLLDLLPEQKYSTRSLSSCEKELRFLYNHSLSTMQSRLSKLDKENLQYIQWVLHSDSATATEAKSKLLYFLLGGVEPRDAEAYIKNIDE